jgi:hypothetical protein
MPEEDAAFLEALTRLDGTYQETPEPEELDTLLWQVCATLPLRLVD